MGPHSLPPDPCPRGVDDTRIAQLLLGGDDEEASRHVLECPVCAKSYFDHVSVRALVRQIAASDAPRAAHSGTRAPRRAWRRLPLAAAILVGLAGVATAMAFLVPWSAFLDTGWRAEPTVGDYESMQRVDFRAAGLDPSARVAATAKFLGGEQTVGTVLAVHLGTDRKLDLAAFRQSGEVAWTARRLWRDWEATLGVGVIDVHRLDSIVSRRTPDETEERLCLLASHLNVGACFVVDPVTGVREGTYFHPGRLGQEVEIHGAIHVLPGGPGPRRRLLVLGEHGYGTKTSPCLSVIECDGTLVQHVELPSLGLASRSDGPFVGVWVDWTPGAAELHAATSDGLVFRIPIADASLVPAGAQALRGDRLKGNFDRARGTAGAFETWLQSEGGEDAALAKLAARVITTRFEPLSGWGDR